MRRFSALPRCESRTSLNSYAEATGRTTAGSKFPRTLSGPRGREYQYHDRPKLPVRRRYNRCWRWWRQRLQDPFGACVVVTLDMLLATANDFCCRPMDESPQPLLYANLRTFQAFTAFLDRPQGLLPNVKGTYAARLERLQCG